MNVAIAYGISIFSTLVLILLWFINTYKILYQKRDGVYKAIEEMKLHEEGYIEKLGSPDEETAKHMLDTSYQIYEQIKETYNKTLKIPLYIIPGFLMGFKNI